MKSTFLSFLHAFVETTLAENQPEFELFLENIINDKTKKKEFENELANEHNKKVLYFLISSTPHKHMPTLIKYATNNPQSELTPIVIKTFYWLSEDKKNIQSIHTILNKVQKMGIIVPLLEKITEFSIPDSIEEFLYEEFNKLSLQSKRKILSTLIKNPNLANKFHFRGQFSPYNNTRSSIIPILTDDIIYKKTFGNLGRHIFKFYIPNEDNIDKEIIRISFSKKATDRNIRLQCLKLYKTYKELLKKCAACVQVDNSCVQIYCQKINGIFVIITKTGENIYPSELTSIIKRIEKGQINCIYCNNN